MEVAGPAERIGGGRLWIYRFDASDAIHYLSSSGESLERIIEAECWSDNPDCK